jgi:hypothetical protein
MLPLMDGKQKTSIDVVIRDGSLSRRKRNGL